MAEPFRDDPFAAPPSGTDPAVEAGPHRSAFESVVHHLVDAGPEVAEHVVGAAQELLLAAQAIVTAAERAVAEQRAQREGAPTPEPDSLLRPVADEAE